MLERTFLADDRLLPEVIELIETELEQVDCPSRAMMQITVAAEEIFVNIAHYAYPDAPGDMVFRLSVDEQQAELQFVDRGIPFDPLAKEDPDVTQAAEERAVGGLGILMVKKTMDEVQYERTDGQNIFTMRKRLV